MVEGAETEVGIVLALDAEADRGAGDGPVVVDQVIGRVVTATVLQTALVCGTEQRMSYKSYMRRWMWGQRLME